MDQHDHLNRHHLEAIIDLLHKSAEYLHNYLISKWHYHHLFFFFKDTPPPEIYPLPLPHALPILAGIADAGPRSPIAATAATLSFRQQLSVPLGLLVSFHRTANCAMPTEIHPRKRSTPNPNRAMSRRPTLRLITSRHLTSIISLVRSCTSQSNARYRSCGVCGRGDGEIN